MWIPKEICACAAEAEARSSVESAIVCMHLFMTEPVCKCEADMCSAMAEVQRPSPYAPTAASLQLFPVDC